ncbi:MAG: acetate/propionate family kinase [Solirubrobacteraceae bacterium]
MRVLVCNAGSSTLKLSLLDERDATLCSSELTAAEAIASDGALRDALAGPLREAEAIGHRIVHGGRRVTAPVRVDEEVERDLRELVELAPLHQEPALAALDAVGAALPGLPTVACFDTAFHHTLPAAACTYAVPADWRERWGLRRYGFHGLSHAWVARRAPALLGRDPAGLRIVSCHLGAGASLCAIGDGRSLDTTMGFTPLEGLVMATRSGSVDPGLLLWLAEHERMSASELSQALELRSGLLALCGSSDMREIVAGADAGDGRAQLALDVYIHRLRAGIAAMTASLGGIDVLVFTGGVGEHSPRVRALAAAGLAFLGVNIDEQRNRDAVGDAEIAAPGARVASLVLSSREDIEIARQVRTALAAVSPGRKLPAPG